jgi:RNA polymerase sigma-70 factor (ECF subfamily)
MVSSSLRQLTLAPISGAELANRGSGVAPVNTAQGRGNFTLEEVYANHFRYVWRSVKALGVPAAAVDDAVHEIFLVVQRRLPDFDGERAHITTWLYEIALRVALRYRTQAKRDADRWAEPTSELPCNRSAEGAEHQERLRLAQQALQLLDDSKRTIFVLAFVEQRTAPEIAEIVGAPLNTVYTRMRAARRDFEVAVAQLSQVSEGDLT